MSIGYSVDVDWSEDYIYSPEKWENVGRRVLIDACKHHDEDKGKNSSNNLEYSGYCEKCSVSADDSEPMMNYAYPLEFEVSDEKVLEIVRRTNCTVMLNTETDAWFLALTGDGMDLSQDIALAFVIAQKWIPTDLLQGVSAQVGLSKDGKEFRRFARVIVEQSNMEVSRMTENAKKWKQAIKESLAQDKQRREDRKKKEAS